MNDDQFGYEVSVPMAGMSGFTDEERDRIREQLVENGRELLLTYGPEKTTVADITDPVGIAKPTFYQFFDSKAGLYLEILRREGEKYRENLRDDLDGIEDPCEGLEVLFQNYRAYAENNPFIQQMLGMDDYRDMLRNVPQDQLEAVKEEKIENAVPFIATFQKRSDGLLAEHDPEAILGVMGTIGLVVLHRDEFEEYGDEYYDRTQNLLIEALAKGLTA